MRLLPLYRRVQERNPLSLTCTLTCLNSVKEVLFIQSELLILISCVVPRFIPPSNASKAVIYFPISVHRLRPDLEVFPTDPRISVELASIAVFLTTYVKDSEPYIFISIYSSDDSGIIVLTREKLKKYQKLKDEKIPVDLDVFRPFEVQIVPGS